MPNHAILSPPGNRMPPYSSGSSEVVHNTLLQFSQGLRYPAARTTLKTLHCVFYKVLEIVFPRGNWQNPPHPPLWHNSPPFAPPSSDILQEINCFALQLNISIHLLLDSLLFSSLNKWVSVLFSQKLLHSSTHQYIACCACSL